MTQEEENAARNRACIVTEGRAQPFCSLCKLDIVDTPKAIKAHLKSKPHKEKFRAKYPDAAGNVEPPTGAKARDERAGDSDDGDRKKKRKRDKEDRKKKRSDSGGEDDEPRETKRRKDGDRGQDEGGMTKVPKKKRVAIAQVPAGCLAVHVQNIPSSASQKSQGVLRKLFPKATKVVYGAPGKARVCFLETADIPEALAVDGTLLDGSALEVTAERAEQVAEEAQKAAAGHEVFLKWLPPEAEEGQLAETFKCCGEILGDVRLKRNPQDGSCMGIGWITFLSADAAKKAVRTHDRLQVPGHLIIYMLYIPYISYTSYIYIYIYIWPCNM